MIRISKSESALNNLSGSFGVHPQPQPLVADPPHLVASPQPWKLLVGRVEGQAAQVAQSLVRPLTPQDRRVAQLKPMVDKRDQWFCPIYAKAFTRTVRAWRDGARATSVGWGIAAGLGGAAQCATGNLLFFAGLCRYLVADVQGRPYSSPRTEGGVQEDVALRSLRDITSLLRASQNSVRLLLQSGVATSEEALRLTSLVRTALAQFEAQLAQCSERRLHGSDEFDKYIRGLKSELVEYAALIAHYGTGA